MRRVEEIKAEIAELNPVEVRKVAKWLVEYEAGLWDKQIENDADAGKLDRFIKEAFEEYSQGKTRQLP
jgi:predicted esterase